MISIDFNTTHFGFFKNTTNWQQLCQNIHNKPYVADYHEQKTDFFIQRFLIQAIMLQGNEFKNSNLVNKEPDELINEKIQFSILKYFFENDIDLFRFNIVLNTMLTIIKNKPFIIGLLQKDANSFAFNKQLILEIPIKDIETKIIKI